MSILFARTAEVKIRLNWTTGGQIRMESTVEADYIKSKNIEELKQYAMDAVIISTNRLSAIDELGRLSKTEDKAVKALLEIAKNGIYDIERKRAISYLLKHAWRRWTGDTNE